MGKKIEIKIYHHAGHAFANPNDERRRCGRCLEAQGRVSSDDAEKLMAMTGEI
jgi:dienelactone hydrolase